MNNIDERNIKTLAQENREMRNDLFELKAKFNELRQNQQKLMLEFAKVRQEMLIHKASTMGSGATSGN